MNEAGLSDEQLSAELKKWTGGTPALHPVGELLDRHWEAAFAYARLCTDGTRAAGMLTTAAFTRLFGESLRQVGPTAAWRPHVLIAVRRIAAEWDADGRQELLHPALRSGPAGESAAARLLPPPGRRQLSRAFQRVPQISRAVLWHTEVESEPLTVPAALLGLDEEDARVELRRARERLREECLQVHRELAAEDDCQRYLRMLDVTFRRGGVDVDPDLREHMGRCGHCRRTADQLAAFNSGLGLALAEAVLGWGADAYLESRADRPETPTEPAPPPSTVAPPPGEAFWPATPPGGTGSAESPAGAGPAGAGGWDGFAEPARGGGSGESRRRDVSPGSARGRASEGAGGWDGFAEPAREGGPGESPRRDASPASFASAGARGWEAVAEFMRRGGTAESVGRGGSAGPSRRRGLTEETGGPGAAESPGGGWDGFAEPSRRGGPGESPRREVSSGSRRRRGSAGAADGAGEPVGGLGTDDVRPRGAASAGAGEGVVSGRSAQRAARVRRARRRHLAVAVGTVSGLVVLPLVLWSVLGSGDGPAPAGEGTASKAPGKDAPRPGVSWAGAHASGQGALHGRLRNLASGLCVGVVGKRPVKGAEAELATCSGTASQQWTYETDGRLRSSAAPDLCLDSHLGYSVRLAPCSATAAAGRNIRYDFTLQGALIPRWNQDLALTPAATDGSGALVLKTRAAGTAQRWAVDTAKPDLQMQNVNWDSESSPSPAATSHRSVPPATPTPTASRATPSPPSPTPTATGSASSPTPSATVDPCSAYPYPYYCGGGHGGYPGGHHHR
ncbi:RICIN domain-containing protein [Streptomyces durhamensis]|uniref:RICIN domain-containing protein n=1 Tax=Streptomyces durhamensis TaxID=68194 RepID=UPI00099C7309|nr:RICIN domain-containing protein [Streptomyces durhamensis]